MDIPSHKFEPTYQTTAEPVLSPPPPSDPEFGPSILGRRIRPWRRVAAIAMATASLVGVNSALDDGLEDGMVPQPFMEEIAASSVPHKIQAEGGLWLHNGPGLNTPLIEIMPDGANFNVQCWQTSDWVTKKNNMWLHGVYNSPTRGPITGDASDVFIDTKWQAPSQLTAQGIPPCGAQTPTPNAAPTPPPPKPAEAKPKTLFYSPWTPPGGFEDMNGKVADVELPLSKWSNGNNSCATEKAVNVPRSIDTLAGWSLGRVGVTYFLMGANSEQLRNVHNIVLIDPGASSDIEGGGLGPVRIQPACDYTLKPAHRLAQWLNDPEKRNRLMILTGRDTEMKVDPKNPNSESKYKALWKYYLPEIWNQKSFADRAVICDYNDMDHHDIFRTYYDVVRSRPTTCPPARDEHKLTMWHP